jgi:ABC-type molybdate transport system substrate-binding protein
MPCDGTPATAKAARIGGAAPNEAGGFRFPRGAIRSTIEKSNRAKLVLSAGGQEQIAKGEVDIGLFNVSEIPRAKGVVMAGPVPAAVQVYINYDAAIPAASSAVEPALALLKYFTSKSAQPRWQAAGLELARE